MTPMSPDRLLHHRPSTGAWIVDGVSGETRFGGALDVPVAGTYLPR
ncbi:MAG: hypothetical protein WBA97_22330 [Actinophytocola sp.]